MVNRNIQAKILKRKRYRRFARFSGATSKFAVRVDTVLTHVDEDKTKIKEIEILVGPVSLTNQVINSGRGPNAERMQQYYNTVKPESFAEPLPVRVDEVMKAWLAQYTLIIHETPIQNRINLIETIYGRLDLFFSQSAKEWFFVDVDLQQEIIRRSRVYSDKKTAIDRLKNKRVSWIETLSSKP